MIDQFMEMLKERDDEGSCIIGGLNYAGEAYDRLEAAQDKIERLREALARLIGSYEEYVRQQYPAGSFKYPAVKRQHDVDMAPAVRARLVLRETDNE